MASMHGNGFGSSMRNLRDDIGSLADDIARVLQNDTSGRADDIKQRMQRLRNDLEEVGSETSSKARGLVESANLGWVADSIEDNARARPWASLAIAAGLGMLASQAWPSRSSASGSDGGEWMGRGASDLYRRARNNVGNAVSSASSKGAEFLERAGLDDVTDTIEENVGGRPWGMMALAAGLGMAYAAWRWSASGDNTQLERTEDWRRRGTPQDWKGQARSAPIWNWGGAH